MADVPVMQGSDVAWANQTSLHPAALAALLVLGAATLVLPRRLAIWPFIIIACFIAPAQRLVVAGLDFNLLRIMVLFGWTRVLARGEWSGFKPHAVDVTLVAFSITTTIAYVTLWQTQDALIFMLGNMFDAIGMYFLFRCLIRGWQDLDRTVVGFALVSIPVALAFFIEHQTGRNLFAFLGGVPEITVVRDGRLRCQGAFSDPILAGAFWASLMPLFAARRWLGPNARTLTVVSLITSLAIIYFTASSTPVMAVVFVIFGMAMFLARRSMMLVKVGSLGMLVTLHFVMERPVYYLIARMNIVSGSTGWHRYHLIHQTVLNFHDWWLNGTKSTGAWHFLLKDVTNQYILTGVRGGLLAMVLFILVILLAFNAVGRLWRSSTDNPYRTIMAWALGVSLFVHVTTFFAVSYFGQIQMVWYLLLASIVSLSTLQARHQTRPAPAARRKGGASLARARRGPIVTPQMARQ